MKLPFSLIQHETKEMIQWKNSELLTEDRCYGRPVFWESGTVYEGGECLLITEKNKEINTIPSNAICIFLFDLDVLDKRGDIVYGYLDSPDMLGKVLNKFHHMFDHYEKWESELKTLVAEKGTISQILRASRAVLKNPIAMMNIQYVIFAHSDSTEFMQRSNMPKLDAQGRIPDYLVNFFKNDSFFLEVADYNSPFLYTGEYLPRQVLCQNLFYQEMYVARVSVDSFEHDFYPWDAFLLKVMTHYLELMYANELQFSRDANAYSQTLHNMLFGQPVSEAEVWQMLSSRNWNEDDFYCVAVLLPSMQDISNNTLNFYCYRIMMEFADCLAIAENEQIIVLFHLKTADSFSEQFHQKMAVFIRENNFRIGFSNCFQGISSLPEFYRQSAVALAYGEKKDATIWKHFFDEYVMDYIRDRCCSEISGQNLCAKEIRVLKDYDIRNNTEFCRTLQVYLENRQSPVKTAKELFIQRGTLNYRLKRIQHLTKIDFSDRKKIEYLMFSYLLLGE